MWLTTFLPEPLLAQCDRAAVVDQEILPDCETIVKRLAQPLLVAIALGLPKEADAGGMAGEDLRRYVGQLDALAHVRILLDELGVCENDADTVAKALLDKVYTARVDNDTEQAGHLSDLADGNRDRLRCAREEVAARERALAALPDPDSLTNENDRVVGRWERWNAETMLGFARESLESESKVEELMRSVVSDHAEASGQLTALFDYGWRTLLGEAVVRRRVRHRKENRRLLWRRVRWLLTLVLSVVIGLGVEAATKSSTRGVLYGLVTALGLGLFEHLLLEPLLGRRAGAADARALKEEVAVTAQFWVHIRTQQAFLNDYARSHLEEGQKPVDLVPLPLKSPRQASV